LQFGKNIACTISRHQSANWRLGTTALVHIGAIAYFRFYYFAVLVLDMEGA